jgi:DNA repair exonuclease SbcCD ATPase subunit
MAQRKKGTEMTKILVALVVVAFAALFTRAYGQGAVKGDEPGRIIVAAPGASDAKSVDELLAEVDARMAAVEAKQQEIHGKSRALDEQEAKLRNDVMETGKKMWGMTDLDKTGGDDEEMAALKKKIADLESQIKGLREQMQKKLEDNPQFLQRKIALKDSQEALTNFRKGRGDMMQEMAKLNAEHNQLERDRLALLMRKEKEAKEKKSGN